MEERFYFTDGKMTIPGGRSAALQNKMRFLFIIIFF
jgi:hypothetical protein